MQPVHVAGCCTNQESVSLQVLTAGGGFSDYFASFPQSIPDAALYDPLARTWSTVANMSVPRVEHQVMIRGTGESLDQSWGSCSLPMHGTEHCHSMHMPDDNAQ